MVVRDIFGRVGSAVNFGERMQSHQVLPFDGSDPLVTGLEWYEEHGFYPSLNSVVNIGSEEDKKYLICSSIIFRLHLESAKNKDDDKYKRLVDILVEAQPSEFEVARSKQDLFSKWYEEEEMVEYYLTTSLPKRSQLTESATYPKFKPTTAHDILSAKSVENSGCSYVECDDFYLFWKKLDKTGKNTYLANLVALVQKIYPDANKAIVAQLLSRLTDTESSEFCRTKVTPAERKVARALLDVFDAIPVPDNFIQCDAIKKGKQSQQSKSAGSGKTGSSHFEQSEIEPDFEDEENSESIFNRSK